MTTHQTNQINTKLAILVKGSWKEPYMLSVHGETTSITRDHKWNLFDTVNCELGKGVRIADKITLHKSAHYYGHFL